MSARAPSHLRQRAFALAVGAAASAFAWFVVRDLLPTHAGKLGHDYAYFFPRLLAGAYWAERNGASSIPWFTPAFGGGLPFYAHPASFYVSAPQAFVLAGASALAAVQITFVAFAALGFLGTWKLLRGSFGASAPAAAFGACAFAWNDFFAARMAIGHLGFHSLMLAPLAAHLCLRPLPSERRARRTRLALDGLLAGLVLAYFFQSGNFYGLVPAALAMVALALVAALRGAPLSAFVARFAMAIAWSVALCAAKLAASLAFLAHAPREGYPLPGADGVIATLWLLFGALFFVPPTGIAAEVLRNTQYGLDRHELEFGVTWVVGLWLVAGLVSLRAVFNDRATLRRNLLLLAALAVVLSIPVAVNVYTPGWNELLKRVPIVKSSSNLFRWFAAYVPIVCVLAALALDRQRRIRTIAAALSITLVALVHARADRDFYRAQGYDPARIESALAALHARGEVRPIERVVAHRNAEGRISFVGPRDDAIANGGSQMITYEPMFGYALEWFPMGTLHPGDPFAARDGELNFKNPAGYLFPKENGVEPGGHFRVGDESRLRALLDYRPLEFARPTLQSVAEWINVLALATALAALAAFAWTHRRAARSARSSHPDRA